MSRARPVILPDALSPLFEADPAFDGQKYWMDVSRNGEMASSRQLELLAVVEDVDLDDLLDTLVTQGDVLKRLRFALGQDPIPTDILMRRELWRAQRQLQPCCRKCGKEGDSTKHHFINKWILRELRDYTQKWADRSKNCIPLCIDCHRHLHQRFDRANKSIAEHLEDAERRFAQAALDALELERPRLLLLIAKGDPEVYETKLVRDWIEGAFASTPAIPYAHQLRAVA